MKLVGQLSSLLWLTLGVLLTCSTAIAQGVLPLDTASKALDIAAGKDIVWLSLAVALAAIGVIFWLVKILVKQQADTIRAITSLCDKLEQRPCFKDKENLK